MSRSIIVVNVLLAGAVASIITVLAVRPGVHQKKDMSDEQRLVRERFFGANEHLPPIR